VVIRSTRPTLAERAAEAAARQTAQQREARASAREDIKRSMRVKFLELLMPNRKALGNCTGAECRGFGSWYGRIADRVPPTELVGTVLDEATLGGLYEAAA
jgi:hypothetical protein